MVSSYTSSHKQAKKPRPPEWSHPAKQLIAKAQILLRATRVKRNKGINRETRFREAVSEPPRRVGLTWEALNSHEVARCYEVRRDEWLSFRVENSGGASVCSWKWSQIFLQVEVEPTRSLLKSSTTFCSSVVCFTNKKNSFLSPITMNFSKPLDSGPTASFHGFQPQEQIWDTNTVNSVWKLIPKVNNTFSLKINKETV